MFTWMIFSFTPLTSTPTNHVNQVLERLLANHLYVKAEKSLFHADTVSFLGFIIAPGSVQMDPAKVSAVSEWPTPDSRKKVQQFLGFANFYRRFAQLQPLSMLSRLHRGSSGGAPKPRRRSVHSSVGSPPPPS